MQLLNTIQIIVIGSINDIMIPLIIVFVINMIVNFMDNASKLQTLKIIAKKILAYLIFIILANQIDSLVINHVLDFKGSTQLSVSVILFGREFKTILRSIKVLGVDVPNILSKTANSIDGGSLNESSDIDEQIIQLRNKISKLKKLQKLQEQLDAVEAAEEVTE